jgi:uncharacterized protein YaaW (UPF0174 family)
VEVAQVAQLMVLEHLARLTLAVEAAVAQQVADQVVLAAQALSFFATPAQFNISLVELFLPIAGMSYIHLPRLEH